jgi:hypothetical protein
MSIYCVKMILLQNGLHSRTEVAMDKTAKEERKRMRYIRRHKETVHDLGGWLMMHLQWARWMYLGTGSQVGPPFSMRLSFGAETRNWFRHGAITPEQIKGIGEHSPGHGAICRILQARAAGEPIAKADLESLQDSLNCRPVTLCSPDGRRIEQDDPQYDRAATEILIQYLDSLMWSHVSDAIGICDACRGLFLRIKTNQSVCSKACRLESLKRVGYWSPEKRQARWIRNQKAAAHRKTNGIFNGKLSGKTRERQGKSKTK